MPLQKQQLDIPFGLGIDSRTDDKNVLPGKMIELENAVIDKVGRITKRGGLVQVGANPRNIAADANELYARYATDTPGAGIGVSGVEFIAESGGTGAASPLSSVLTRLTGTPASATTGTLSGPVEASVISADMAMDSIGKKYGLLAYVDQSGMLWLTSVDFATMQPIVTVRTLLTNATAVRVFARGTSDGFIVVYSSGTAGTGGVTVSDNINPSTFSAGTSYVLPGAGASLATTVVDTRGGFWDCTVSAGNLYVALYAGADTVNTVRYVIGTWGAGTTASFVTGLSPFVTCLCLFADASLGSVGVLVGESGGGSTRYIRYNSTTMAVQTALTTPPAPTTFSNTQSISAKFISSQGAVQIAVQQGTSATSVNSQVQFYRINTAGTTLATNNTSITGALLAGTLTQDNDLDVVIPLFFGQPLQQSIFFYKIQGFAVSDVYTPSLIGRVFFQTAGLMFTRLLPRTDGFSRDGLVQSASLAALYAGVNTSTTFISTSLYGAACVEAERGGDQKYPQCELNGRAYFGGGYLHTISPTGALPVGFLTEPVVTSTTPLTSGGSIPDGTYSTVLLFERTDENGEIQQSAPCSPVSTTISGGGGAGRITVNMSLFLPEQRQYATGGSTVFVVAYRTVAGGTTYYRDRRVAVTSYTASMTLSSSSTSLAQQSIMPFSAGAELEPLQVDCPVALASDGDRIWAVPGSARSTVVPSKPKVQGVGLAFLPVTYRTVQALSGEIKALARQDNKLLAFGRVGVAIATGRGPDATGASDDLSEFSLLFSRAGAEKHGAVLVSNNGVYAKDSTDIWYIGRDLQLNRIGSDVERYTTLAFRAGAVISSQKQVRFLVGPDNSTRTELLLDEETGQWSVLPRAALSTSAPGLAVRNGTAIYYALDGKVYSESSSIFTDNGTGYSLRAVTAWLKPGLKLQGFGRIYKALLLGNNLAAHTLQVRVRYDYETSFSETHTISSANATSVNGVWQPEIRFRRQKCEAFQLEIQDTSPTGQGFSLSGLELTVGVKPNSNRQVAAKRF